MDNCVRVAASRLVKRGVGIKDLAPDNKAAANRTGSTLANQASLCKQCCLGSIQSMQGNDMAQSIVATSVMSLPNGSLDLPCPS